MVGGDIVRLPCRHRARRIRPCRGGRSPGTHWCRNFSLQTDYVVAIVAVLGTTITPYCFFWQSSQEAEDERIDPDASSLLDAPEQAPAEISRMRIDTYVGMGYSNLISWFILVTTAATLRRAWHQRQHQHVRAGGGGVAAGVAGQFAFFVFAAGIIGIGLLAVPVLAELIRLCAAGRSSGLDHGTVA